MALAVAMVACQGAAGVDGKDAAAPKLAPFKVGSISAMMLKAGTTETVDLSGYFSDPEGKTLTYTAVSSMTKYATVAPKGAMLTVTAVAAGKSTITVTATDPDKKMATQTFMVTVTAATTTPAGPMVTMPIADMTLEPEKTFTVDLSKHFSGATSYAAVSDMEDIVTVPAMATGTTLTVTATMKEGVAMITVTASDSADPANTAKDMFKVTVSKTSDTTDVTIEGVEMKAPVTIGEGQILVSADPNIASVARVAGSMTDWEVKGVKKGSTTLSVEDAQGKVVSNRMVKVGNTAPTVKTANTGAYYTLTLYPATIATPPTTAAYSVEIPGLARVYHSLEWLAMVRPATAPPMKTDIRELFTDKDGDKLTLTAMSESPDVRLVAINEAGMLVVDVIRFQGASFNIVVTADDGDGGMVSEQLSVQTMNPSGDSNYKIRQLPDKAFSLVKVYERHAAHFATFTTAANVDFEATGGLLAFAAEALTNAEAAAKAPKGYSVLSDVDYPSGAVSDPNTIGTAPPADQAAGFHITVKGKSGPIKAVKFANPDATADVRSGLGFTVSGSGTAVIEITTHAVHAKGTFDAADGITEVAFNALPGFTTVNTMKTITLNIVKVRGANTITS